MSLLRDFRKFALRGNLFDLAVGFTVGATFSTIAKSLVSDIIMPPVGLILGRSDFSDFFWVLKSGPDEVGPYITLADAQAAGAVTVNYGVFINNLLAFLVVAFAMFLIIRLMSRAEASLDAHFGEEEVQGEPVDKKCPFCRSIIAYKAVRCPQCTSQLCDPPRTLAEIPNTNP